MNEDGTFNEEKSNEIPEPKWHDIRIGFDERTPSTGQVLASFVVVPDDFEFVTPSQYLKLENYIPHQEYLVDINILGLRNLESFGMLPVQKPFIKFRIKSLLPPDKAQAVTNVTTDPNAVGPNPNINTLITFSVQLPQQELYCPKLSCDVYDYVFKGLSQPLIGTFSIPTGKIKSTQQKNQETLLLTCEDIIRDLQEHLQRSPEEMQEVAKQNFNNTISKEALEYASRRAKRAIALEFQPGKKSSFRRDNTNKKVVNEIEEEPQLLAKRKEDGAEYEELVDDNEAQLSQAHDEEDKTLQPDSNQVAEDLEEEVKVVDLSDREDLEIAEKEAVM